MSVTPTPTPTWVRSERESEITGGWGSYIGFAAVMLVLAGVFQGIAGLVCIFRDNFYGVPYEHLLVAVDYTVWGWTHIALGAVAIAVGLGLLWARAWARWAGIGVAVISAVVSLGFLEARPVWSTLIIAFDVIVIWALTVHGSEMESV